MITDDTWMKEQGLIENVNKACYSGGYKDLSERTARRQSRHDVDEVFTTINCGNMPEHQWRMKVTIIET